eukprot:3515447-Prorocentrum_lima.AAC.1
MRGTSARCLTTCLATGQQPGGQSDSPESLIPVSWPTPTSPSRCPPSSIQSHQSPPCAPPHTPTWPTPT